MTTAKSCHFLVTFRNKKSVKDFLKYFHSICNVLNLFAYICINNSLMNILSYFTTKTLAVVLYGANTPTNRQKVLRRLENNRLFTHAERVALTEFLKDFSEKINSEIK